METYLGFNPLEEDNGPSFIESDFLLRLEKINKLKKKLNENPEQLLGINYDKLFYNFIQKCLEIEPSKRSSAITLLNHKWLETVKNADKKQAVEGLTYKYLLEYTLGKKKKESSFGFDNTGYSSESSDIFK